MSITYPLTLPTSPSIREMTWTPQTNVAVSTSEFTGEQQVYEHQGMWWNVEVALPPMERAEAEEWISFFLKLNGQQGTFRMGDPDGTTARGVATGTPLVNGASQTGKSLITDGWTISTTDILKAGDWIQIGDYAYKNLNDVNSDGSGNATLDIWPRLRSSPGNNATIIVASPTSLFRLASNTMVWNSNDLTHYGISFRAIEAI